MRGVARAQARRRGVVSMDTAVGLAMVVALIGTLAAVGVQHRRTQKALDERRAAARVLELQAGRMQSGQAVNDLATLKAEPLGDWVRLARPASGGEVELYVYMPQREAWQDAEVQP